MKYLFKLFLSVYFLSYLFPFAQGLLGYEIEFEMWDVILNDEIPNTRVATVWSLRLLVTIVLLGMYWLKNPEINTWVSIHLDKVFLDKLLIVILFILVSYPFIFENINWNWGGISWAGAAILTGIAYLTTEDLLTPKEVFYSLEEHLVELEEGND